MINSSNNEISQNRIISHSENPHEYAVEIISDKNLDNKVVKNYLISANGLRYADEAVNAEFDMVDLNTPRDVFVSANGSDVAGDGSESNPYQTISKAIENALNHSIIYVSYGNYNESNIRISYLTYPSIHHLQYLDSLLGMLTTLKEVPYLSTMVNCLSTTHTFSIPVHILTIQTLFSIGM